MMATGYPDNWLEIAQHIKGLAGWRCENCGHPHDFETGHVLTVHHLDMDPSNCDYTNLVALCQRCHLHIQATYKPGQQFMFDKPQWAEIRGL
jgi:5-methylcytosine-specific restriction endonuclease McrA